MYTYNKKKFSNHPLPTDDWKNMYLREVNKPFLKKNKKTRYLIGLDVTSMEV